MTVRWRGIALIESVNTRLRLLTRIGFGFHSTQPLIALAMLSLGGRRPTLQHANDPHMHQERRIRPKLSAAA